MHSLEEIKMMNKPVLEIGGIKVYSNDVVKTLEKERDKMQQAILIALMEARFFYEQERPVTKEDYDKLVELIGEGLEGEEDERLEELLYKTEKERDLYKKALKEIAGIFDPYAAHDGEMKEIAERALKLGVYDNKLEKMK